MTAQDFSDELRKRGPEDSTAYIIVMLGVLQKLNDMFGTTHEFVVGTDGVYIQNGQGDIVAGTPAHKIPKGEHRCSYEDVVIDVNRILRQQKEM